MSVGAGQASGFRTGRFPDGVSVLTLLFRAGGTVEFGIAGVEILRVEMILRDAEGIGEPLVMHDLPGAEELDRLSDVGIVDEAKNVVVGRACLLLCYYHVFATTLSVALRRHLSQRARLLYV